MVGGAGAVGDYYARLAQAMGMAAANAVNAQQQAWVTSQAATTEGISTLFALDVAAAGAATHDELQPAKAPGAAGAGEER